MLYVERKAYLTGVLEDLTVVGNARITLVKACQRLECAG